jgi:hypothetical protein
VGVILPSALMGDFVKENHFRVGEFKLELDKTDLCNIVVKLLLL